MRIISKETYKENKERLMSEYKDNIKNICKKFNISQQTYDLISSILKNEKFKDSIDELARDGAYVDGEVGKHIYL